MSKVRCMWRVKYPTLFCYKLLDLCLVHLRKCLFQLWFSSNKATAVITYMYEFRHWSTNGEKPSQCTVEQVGVHSFQYLDVNGTTTQTGADESPGFWNGFTTSESSRWVFPGAKGIEADICEGWAGLRLINFLQFIQDSIRLDIIPWALATH